MERFVTDGLSQNAGVGAAMYDCQCLMVAA